MARPLTRGKSSYRVLVVDDQPGIRFILKEVMMGEGWDVWEAGAGDEALVFPLEQVDLCLVDVKMPRMNGLQFLDAIRRRGYSGPVVLLTAYNDIQFSVPVMENIYRLQKPFNLDEVRSLARKAVGGTEKFSCSIG